MKAVLISIRPYYVFLIIAKAMGWSIDKEKTVEVRKNYPTDKEWNKSVKIYCSKDQKSFAKIPKEFQSGMERFLGKVVGEFVCDKICAVLAHPDIFAGHPMFFQFAIDAACLTQDEVEQYSGGKDVVGLVITELKVYDKPRELGEFTVASKYGCCNECVCRGCPHFEKGNGIDIEDDCLADFDTDVYKPLRRPPQSWCYVEDVNQGGMCEK